MRPITILLLLAACSSEVEPPGDAGADEALSAHSSSGSNGPGPDDPLQAIHAMAGAEAIMLHDGAVDEAPADAGSPEPPTPTPNPPDSGSDTDGSSEPSDAGEPDGNPSPDPWCEPVGEPASDCDDGDPCTVDTCINEGFPSEGCLNSPIQCPTGQGCVEGSCQICGDRNQQCCRHDKCGDGLECVSGTCRCGAQGQPCCHDPTCPEPTLGCMCDTGLVCHLVIPMQECWP